MVRTPHRSVDEPGESSIRTPDHLAPQMAHANNQQYLPHVEQYILRLPALRQHKIEQLNRYSASMGMKTPPLQRGTQCSRKRRGIQKIPPNSSIKTIETSIKHGRQRRPGANVLRRIPEYQSEPALRKSARTAAASPLGACRENCGQGRVLATRPCRCPCPTETVDVTTWEMCTTNCTGTPGMWTKSTSTWNPRPGACTM